MQKEENKWLFKDSYLRNGMCDFLQIWYVGFLICWHLHSKFLVSRDHTTTNGHKMVFLRVNHTCRVNAYPIFLGCTTHYRVSWFHLNHKIGAILLVIPEICYYVLPRISKQPQQHILHRSINCLIMKYENSLIGRIAHAFAKILTERTAKTAFFTSKLLFSGSSLGI